VGRAVEESSGMGREAIFADGAGEGIIRDKPTSQSCLTIEVIDAEGALCTLMGLPQTLEDVELVI